MQVALEVPVGDGECCCGRMGVDEFLGGEGDDLVGVGQVGALGDVEDLAAPHALGAQPQ